MRPRSDPAEPNNLEPERQKHSKESPSNWPLPPNKRFKRGTPTTATSTLLGADTAVADKRINGAGVAKGDRSWRGHEESILLLAMGKFVGRMRAVKIPDELTGADHSSGAEPADAKHWSWAEGGLQDDVLVDIHSILEDPRILSSDAVQGLLEKPRFLLREAPESPVSTFSRYLSPSLSSAVVANVSTPSSTKPSESLAAIAAGNQVQQMLLVPMNNDHALFRAIEKADAQAHVARMQTCKASGAYLAFLV